MITWFLKSSYKFTKEKQSIELHVILYVYISLIYRKNKQHLLCMTGHASA